MKHGSGESMQQNWFLNRGLLQKLCWDRGWDWSELARRADISRTTLYQWQKQKSVKPRLTTLSKLAEVLDVETRDLMAFGEVDSDGQQHADSHLEADQTGGGPSVSVPWLVEKSDPSEFENNAEAVMFDRLSNWSVQETFEKCPELFHNWTQTEWEELYSSFGTGGELNQQGILNEAELINQKRDTMFQLQVILETHLADAAERIIRSLYESVQCQEVKSSTPVEE